jgi:membrane-associated protease RseP (regulator of RpoE activity)
MGLLIFWAIIFVIIVLHEGGHLLMAKKYGVRVNTYSIGFGPRIIGIKFYQGKISWRIGNKLPTNTKIWFRKDNTEYRIAPVPFGGFCALEGEMKSTGKPYELASKPFGQKVAIALAGVGINFITGLLALFGIAIKNLGFIGGIKNTIIMIYQTIVSLFVGIYLLCSGGAEITKASEVNQLMSGISIEYVIAYFGVFSILLGLTNLLPWPCLDGSLPVLWLLEKLTHNKISKFLQIIWFIGFVSLIVLQIIILWYWIFGV